MIHLTHLFDLLRHLIRIEALAVVTVERDSELFEGYLIFTETYLDKPLPECGILLVMLLELLEFGACSVVESPVFFGFRVKFHIEGDKRVDSCLFRSLRANPRV